MIRTMLFGLAALFVAFGSTATAHQQSLHKGRATSGTVVSLSERGFVLAAATGSVPVTVSESAKFERDGKLVAREEIQKGDHFEVFGTKLETGEIVAREIIVHDSEEGPGHGRGADDQ